MNRFFSFVWFLSISTSYVCTTIDGEQIKTTEIIAFNFRVCFLSSFIAHTLNVNINKNGRKTRICFNQVQKHLVKIMFSSMLELETICIYCNFLVFVYFKDLTIRIILNVESCHEMISCGEIERVRLYSFRLWLHTHAHTTSKCLKDHKKSIRQFKPFNPNVLRRIVN